MSTRGIPATGLPLWSSEIGARGRTYDGEVTGRLDEANRLAASRSAGAGAIGGAADEAGSAHRAAVALHMVVASLTDAPVPEALPIQMRSSDGCGPDQVPAVVRLETDDATDDIAVDLAGGDRVLIQAKLSAGRKVLRAVLFEQWLPAVLDQGWQDRTALVLATERPTNDLRTLGHAWQRRQDPSAGAPTPAELRELENWDDMLRAAIEQLDPTARAKARGRLEGAVALMAVEGRGPDSPGWKLQAARLADSVVPAAQAGAAVYALAEAIRTSAQRRTGGTAYDWTQVLADAQLALIARPDGVTAARVAAECAAIAEYREQLARRLNRLALYPLGVSLSDVIVPGLAGGIRVRDFEQEPDSGVPHNLFGEVRGHRRCLLLGEPGGGKSEALTQLAAFAADPSTARATDPSLEDTWADLGSWAPLPLLVPLTRLLPPNRNDPIIITTDRLAAVATEMLDGEARELTATVAARALRDGSALLLLDGLDECRNRRCDMVAALDGLLDCLHEDVTVLMSSRLSARADADRLGMDPLVLTTPKDLAEATSVVLAAFAAREPAPGVRSDWLQQRRHWLYTQQHGHHELFEIPLMAMLATIVAGQAAYPSRLPHGRAPLVMAVLDLHIERWETRRHHDGGLEIASLAAPAAVAAMQETFNVLAHALNATGDVSRADAAAQVTQLLLDRYLPAPGQAGRAAGDILWAWQESAVFVLADDDALRPRLRLFAEVGEALHAIGRPDELPSWVDARIDDEDRHPELLLAAELSLPVLTLLVARVEGTDPSDLPLLADRITLTVDALESSTATAKAAWGSSLEHGTLATNVDVAALRDRLIAALLAALRGSTSPDHNMSATTGMELANQRTALDEAAPRPAETDSVQIHGWAVWRLTELLVDLAPRDILTADCMPTLAAVLPPELARLAGASLWTRVVFDVGVDGEADLDAVDAGRTSLPDSAVAAWTELLVAGHASPPRDPRRNGLYSWMSRREHGTTLVIAAAVVLPDRPDLATAVYRLRGVCGQTHVDKLDALLEREGHAALLADDRATQARQMTEVASRLATLDGEQPWLAGLAGLAGPVALSNPQRWHLAEIGALVWLYDLNGLQVNEHATVVTRAAQAHRDLDRVAMTLLGLNPGVVATQARQLLDARVPGRHPSAVMLTVYRSAAPLEVDWGRSADASLDRERLVEVLRIGYRMFADSVCELLSYHPDQAGTAQLLVATLPGLRAEAQYRTALYAGDIGGQKVTRTLAADEAPLVRAAAGTLVLLEGGADGGLERLQTFVADPDQSVRALTFGTRKDLIPREARTTIRHWASTLPTQATCLHCGHSNEAATSCGNCSVVLPKVPHWFAGEHEPKPRRPLRRRRRHR